MVGPPFDDNLHILPECKRVLMRIALMPQDAESGDLASILNDSLRQRVALYRQGLALCDQSAICKLCDPVKADMIIPMWSGPHFDLTDGATLRA